MSYLYSTEELLAQKFRYRWVLHNLLPLGGRLLFHGREGSGKSLAALAVAIAVCQNARFLGQWQTYRRGPVLWVQADLPIIEHQRRMQRLRELLPWLQGDALPLYHYVPPWFDIMEWDEEHEDVQAIQRLNPCLVIWDVLQAIQHFKDEKHVPGLVYGQMHRLFPEAGQIIIHHDKKWTEAASQGMLDEREAFSGVKEWINLVVSAWHLTESGPNVWRITTTKNNCGPIPDVVVVKREPATLLPVLAISKIPEEAARWRMKHKCNPHELTPHQREQLAHYLIASGVGTLTGIEQALERF